MPLISVIVPVYNTEKYLKRCIESLLDQDYSDYEILLIDDGSTDGSSDICKQYVSSCDNVFYFCKENGGLSDARNYGSARAKGEYISFVDSDDYVSSNYISELASLIDENTQLASVSILKVGDDAQPADLGSSIISFGRIDAVKDMLYQKHFDTSACGLLIKSNIVSENLFPKGKYHEDDLTTYKFYLSSANAAYSDRAAYYYYQRPGSIMHSVGKAVYDEIDAADALAEHFKNTDASLYKAACSKKFSNYCQVLISTPGLKKEDPDTYKRLCSFVKGMRAQIIFDPDTRLKNKAAAFALIFGVGMLRKLAALNK